jgi:glycosyltransferase involved in cell wall biosynthesis
MALIETLEGPSAAPRLDEGDGLRVLIAHDWLVTWAGSERCVEQMLHVFPQADVLVGVRAPVLREDNAVTRKAAETWLGRLPGARSHHRWFLPIQGLAFASVDTTGYDVVLSSSHAFSKMIRTRPDTPHVCYCYSPPRYLWDLRETYRRRGSAAEGLALSLGGPVLRWMDRRSARGVDRFITCSRYVAARIRRIYGRPAEVVYPPVVRKVGPRVTGPRADFLLSLGRLVSYKRVDLAIKAAERLGMRLVVAGDGPERARLEGLAGPHTEFLGEVTESEAGRLLSSCAALVFCAEEDFGITPVEANAHGAPVIAFGAGGVLDSMTEGETAEFFPRQTVADVAAAIERACARSWDHKVLAKNASRFAPESFRDGLRSVVASALQRGPEAPLAAEGSP